MDRHRLHLRRTVNLYHPFLLISSTHARPFTATSPKPGREPTFLRIQNGACSQPPRQSHSSPSSSTSSYLTCSALHTPKCAPTSPTPPGSSTRSQMPRRARVMQGSLTPRCSAGASSARAARRIAVSDTWGRSPAILAPRCKCATSHRGTIPASGTCALLPFIECQQGCHMACEDDNM